MNWRALVAGAAFALLATPAFAGPLCTHTTDWATLDTPITQKFDGSFDAAGQYVECFTFSPSEAAEGSGHAHGFDVNRNKLDIDVSRVELYRDGDLVGTDTSPNHFDFGALQVGALYTLALYTEVYSASGLMDAPVTYKGVVETTALAQQTVPEPGVPALLGLALIAGSAAMRRRRRTETHGDASAA